MSNFKKLMAAPGMKDASKIPSDATHISVDGDGNVFTWIEKPDWFPVTDEDFYPQNEWSGCDSGAAVMNHMGDVTGFDASTSCFEIERD